MAYGTILCLDGLAKKFGLTPEQFGEKLARQLSEARNRAVSCRALWSWPRTMCAGNAIVANVKLFTY